MFKHILPQEAQVARRANPKMDSHLQGSAFAPLATAMHTGASRLSASIRRFTRQHLS